MAAKKYMNSKGERVSYDDLDEAEQSYYSKSVQKDVAISGISIDEYCRNFWRGNATEGDGDED